MNSILPKISIKNDIPYKNDLANVVKYWGFFSKSELEKEKDSLLMLDIDFGRKCSLKCPTCFRKTNVVDNYKYKDLSFDELVSVIDDARKIGLKVVKICGAGEPFENPDLLKFARLLTSWDIGLSIFTKGHVLGDLELAKKVFVDEKVISLEDFIFRLFELKTSLLISVQSFIPEVQDRIVGNVQGYTKKRNHALEILCDIGFNSTIPTRVAFCTNPITKFNYDELFDIYVFCRERNILPVIAALMISGKQFDQNFLNIIDVSDTKKIQLFNKIYNYNIDNGIQNIDEIIKEGVSCMPGIHPCNQISNGLYLTCNGNVIRCPGDYGNPIGNVHNEKISSIWGNNMNWKYKGIFNVQCPFKDGVTISENLYPTVLNNILLEKKQINIKKINIKNYEKINW
jgi:MoaA/NifB/PqqE/SkfB family radical SAM enzyme